METMNEKNMARYWMRFLAAPKKTTEKAFATHPWPGVLFCVKSFILIFFPNFSLIKTIGPECRKLIDTWQPEFGLDWRSQIPANAQFNLILCAILYSELPHKLSFKSIWIIRSSSAAEHTVDVTVSISFVLMAVICFISCICDVHVSSRLVASFWCVC